MLNMQIPPLSVDNPSLIEAAAYLMRLIQVVKVNINFRRAQVSQGKE